MGRVESSRQRLRHALAWVTFRRIKQIRAEAQQAGYDEGLRAGEQRGRRRGDAEGYRRGFNDGSAAGERVGEARGRRATLAEMLFRKGSRTERIGANGGSQSDSHQEDTWKPEDHVGLYL